MTRLLLVALLISGCATEPVTVRVPVPTECPPPPPRQRPYLPVGDLTETSSPEQIMRAYRATIEVLGGYAEELEFQLDGYRKDPYRND